MILTETGKYFIINYHLRQSDEGVMPYYVNSARGARSPQVARVDSVDRLAVASAPCPYFVVVLLAITCRGGRLCPPSFRGDTRSSLPTLQNVDDHLAGGSFEPVRMDWGDEPLVFHSADSRGD